MEPIVDTPNRILDAAQKLFNQKGYAATTVAEIASSICISPGNLTYHFPAKQDLVIGIRTRVQATLNARWESRQTGAIADDYIEHLLFAMRMTWEIRFLLQDHALLADETGSMENSPFMQSDYLELTGLIKRIFAQKLFRSELDIDTEVLSRTLWISSRYWMDHLRELEGTKQAPWEHLERGIRHHLAVLKLFLTTEAISEFEVALESALRYMKRLSDAATEARPA